MNTSRVLYSIDRSDVSCGGTSSEEESLLSISAFNYTRSSRVKNGRGYFYMSSLMGDERWHERSEVW
jgi:hypothetical protein